MELIPAVDLRRGKLVRLCRGEDARRYDYPWSPEDWLEQLLEAGFRRVHIVDLDAAFGEAPQWNRIASWLERFPGLQFQIGGGFRSREMVSWAIGSGFDRVVVGSWVEQDPVGFRQLAEELPGRLVPALDCRDGAVAVDGWRSVSARSVETLCGLLAGVPCPGVLVTGIDRDGTLAGPDLGLAERIARLSRLPVFLSGGVSGLQDLEKAAAIPGVSAAIVGKALLEGYLDLPTVAQRFRSSSGPAWGRLEGSLRTGLTVRVIPCLDVAGGRVVKGIRFENLRDAGDPAELASAYAEEGADELAFLDIEAAPERRGPRFEWVERVARRVFVPLSVGGGVRSEEDAARLLAAGADKVVVNTQAVQSPELIEQLAHRFGSQSVVVAIDARRRNGLSSWDVVTHGGRELSGKEVRDWAGEVVNRGAGEILLTSIDRDGTRSGYDLELIRVVANLVSVPVIASGGAEGIEDFVRALEVGAAAVLAASVFHHGELTIGKVHEALEARGFPVRCHSGGALK